MQSTSFIVPDWPAPSSVKAITTTRIGGVSKLGFGTNNLATHVGDDPDAVKENRSKLAGYVGLRDSQFCWLNQVHGSKIISACQDEAPLRADGSDSAEINTVCAVLTADCLPVLMCDCEGTRISAVHAGWRGLSNNILSQAVQRFSNPKHIIAWLGPAIGPSRFEVGDEVYQRFTVQSANMDRAFVRKSQQKWLVDIYHLATLQLQAAGVTQVYGGGFCTYTDKEHFYSYRRDGANTGRMASLIWRTN